MPSVWDHDLWQDIYDVPEPLARNVFVQMYRLILDMRESDVLAEKIAARIHKRETLHLSWATKLVGGLAAAVAIAGGIKGLL